MRTYENGSPYVFKGGGDAEEDFKGQETVDMNYIQVLDTEVGRLNALFDTGAEANFISKEKALQLGIRWDSKDTGKVIRVANGSKLAPLGTTRLKVMDSIVEFLVADLKTRADIIMGFPWMKKNRIQLNYDQGEESNMTDVEVMDSKKGSGNGSKRSK